MFLSALTELVTYPLRGGELVNFVGVVEQENPLKEGWRERGDITGLEADFEGWDSYLTGVINSISPEALFRWGLYDRAPFESWTTGRAALLGDAAHPMLPFMAQGAAMAVEDGWVLADELSHSENIGAALSRYEARRKPRASMVQAASRGNMKTFHQRSTFGQIMTYGPMWLAGSYAPSIIRKAQKREERLAETLRENLRKRKAAARKVAQKSATQDKN